MLLVGGLESVCPVLPLLGLCVDFCFLFTSSILDELNCTFLNSISNSSSMINKFSKIMHILQKSIFYLFNLG